MFWYVLFKKEPKSQLFEKSCTKTYNMQSIRFARGIFKGTQFECLFTVFQYIFLLFFINRRILFFVLISCFSFFSKSLFIRFNSLWLSLKYSFRFLSCKIYTFKYCFFFFTHNDSFIFFHMVITQKMKHAVAN